MCSVCFVATHVTYTTHPTLGATSAMLPLASTSTGGPWACLGLSRVLPSQRRRSKQKRPNSIFFRKEHRPVLSWHGGDLVGALCAPMIPTATFAPLFYLFMMNERPLIRSEKNELPLLFFLQTRCRRRRLYTKRILTYVNVRLI
jgi:hypothetical protein